MATFPGSRQYDDEFLVASDPGSTWYTTNNVAYMDQSKVERPQQTDVKILHKVRKPRQRESHYARDAREALKGTAKRNMATMPAAGVPYGHACAPRVTEDGLGVAEVGYPFGTPFIDMKQRRFGNCAGGTTHSKPMRSQTVTGYRADETVQWLKRHKADRHLDVQSIAQKVDQKLQVKFRRVVFRVLQRACGPAGHAHMGMADLPVRCRSVASAVWWAGMCGGMVCRKYFYLYKWCCLRDA